MRHETTSDPDDMYIDTNLAAYQNAFRQIILSSIVVHGLRPRSIPTHQNQGDTTQSERSESGVHAREGRAAVCNGERPETLPVLFTTHMAEERYAVP